MDVLFYGRKWKTRSKVHTEENNMKFIKFIKCSVLWSVSVGVNSFGILCKQFVTAVI